LLVSARWCGLEGGHAFGGRASADKARDQRNHKESVRPPRAGSAPCILLLGLDARLSSRASAPFTSGPSCQGPSSVPNNGSRPSLTLRDPPSKNRRCPCPARHCADLNQRVSLAKIVIVAVCGPRHSRCHLSISRRGEGSLGRRYFRTVVRPPARSPERVEVRILLDQVSLNMYRVLPFFYT
jgi:hypothetical protein